MIVRFGYVAMSMTVKSSSPSKTMTATHFAKLNDREAAVRKLERIAEENLANTLRLLRHNRAHDIKLYRMSSKLIPLIGHELLAGWDPFPRLHEAFRAIGDYARQHAMRLSFHPDHFTVLSTPRPDVLRSSLDDLDRHVRMLEAMGLDKRSMCNIHIGGTYGNKEAACQRFIQQFGAMDKRIRERITLENDDKTFTARETLEAAEELGVPMVFDIHHHDINNEGESYEELWPRIAATWKEAGVTLEHPEPLPPKIHVSSPKSVTDRRGHADYVDPEPLLAFFAAAAPVTERLDVMLEAKMKDEALFALVAAIKDRERIEQLDQASIRYQ